MERKEYTITLKSRVYELIIDEPLKGLYDHIYCFTGDFKSYVNDENNEIIFVKIRKDRAICTFSNDPTYSKSQYAYKDIKSLSKKEFISLLKPFNNIKIK